MQKNNTGVKGTLKKCLVCKCDISAKKSNAKTCSGACRKKLWRKSHIRVKSKCLFCGAKFEARRSTKKYCGRSCQETHARILAKPAAIQRKFDALKLFGVYQNEIPNNIEIEIDELYFFCKAVNINPYKFCSVKEIVAAIRQSENFSIIETCINEIEKPHQAPPTELPKKEINSILNYEEGIFAYQFFEAKTKTKLIERLNTYRASAN